MNYMFRCVPIISFVCCQLLHNFEVPRRMIIDWQKKKLKPVKPEFISVLIGSMCVEKLGHLEKSSDHPALLFPIDYW